MANDLREAAKEAQLLLQLLISATDHSVSSQTIYFQAVASESKLRAALAAQETSEGGRAIRLLERVIDIASLGMFRDSTGLSLATHPIIDELRAFTENSNG